MNMKMRSIETGGTFECAMCGYVYGLHDHLTVARQRMAKMMQEFGGHAPAGPRGMSYLMARGHYEAVLERFKAAQQAAGVDVVEHDVTPVRCDQPPQEGAAPPSPAAQVWRSVEKFE